MTRRIGKVALLACVILAIGADAEEARLSRYEAALNARMAELRIPARERKWEQIPWMTDLTAGWEASRREQRPIFLYVAGDDPLQRC